ncbi:MAG: AAA family ATPase [Myxococcales bacterium]|nr:AAA family ATPase [Myxococcales bacterium]
MDRSISFPPNVAADPWWRRSQLRNIRRATEGQPRPGAAVASRRCRRFPLRSTLPALEVTLVGQSGCRVQRVVTTGRAMPDGLDGNSGGVVILSAEDAPGDTIRPRLDAAGADPTRVRILRAIRGRDEEHSPEIVERADMAGIERAVQECGSRLLIIDPLTAFLGARVNANYDQDVRRALGPLTEMAQRAGVTIIAIRRLNRHLSWWKFDRDHRCVTCRVHRQQGPERPAGARLRECEGEPLAAVGLAGLSRGDSTQRCASHMLDRAVLCFGQRRGAARAQCAGAAAA